MTGDGLPRPERILFLGHGAERTGPPVYLLRLLRWLRAHTEVELEVVLLEGGPLLDELSSLAPVHVVEGPGQVPARPAPVTYVNTAGSVRALDHLPFTPSRLVAHVHELSTGFDLHLSPSDRARLLEAADLVLAVSTPVAEMLVSGHGVDPGRIRMHPGFVDEVPPPRDPPPDRRGLRVVSCGTLDWRKGPDLFVEVVDQLVGSTTGPVEAIWVGGDLDAAVARAVVAEAEARGLDQVRFVGEQPDPAEWFASADVFVLTAREDAFPLVGLEAAAVGLPLVCFDSGGMTDLVGDDAGIVVPFPDTSAMAAALQALAEDPDDARAMGLRGRERVVSRYVPKVAGPRLLADLATLVS